VAVLPEEDMLSTQEAADLLNVSRQYLVRLVGGGEGRKPSGGRDRGFQGRATPSERRRWIA
jgi:excisionase family DNA binding protein